MLEANPHLSRIIPGHLFYYKRVEASFLSQPAKVCPKFWAVETSEVCETSDVWPKILDAPACYLRLDIAWNCVIMTGNQAVKAEENDCIL